MNVKETINARRAYRSLDQVEITRGLAEDLARCASLAPSCFNHQPWRFVFIYGGRSLNAVHDTLAKGNEWARAASMIVAVYSRREDDCTLKEREYYLFDTGLATAFLILRATELGLVAHPIAGYDEVAVRAALEIPDDARVITLVIVGARSASIRPELSEQQAAAEAERPERLRLEAFARMIG